MVSGSLVLLGSYEGHGQGGRPGQEVQGSLLIGVCVCVLLRLVSPEPSEAQRKDKVSRWE